MNWYRQANIKPRSKEDLERIEKDLLKQLGMAQDLTNPPLSPLQVPRTFPGLESRLNDIRKQLKIIEFQEKQKLEMMGVPGELV
jgi:hypothetical protein